MWNNDKSQTHCAQPVTSTEKDRFRFFQTQGNTSACEGPDAHPSSGHVSPGFESSPSAAEAPDTTELCSGTSPFLKQLLALPYPILWG